MKRFIATAALLLAAPFAFAAPATDAQVDKLMSAMRARQTVDAMLPQIENMQKQMVAQMTATHPLTAEQQKKMDATFARGNAAMRDALKWEKLQPVYRDIYRQTFTTDDMDAMIGFYSSPAGQRLLDKMPALMQNTMTAAKRTVGQ